METKRENPRLYISYSRKNQANESWVLRMATELRESGVDVLLDQWDLPEGQNKSAFMEEMVVNPKVEKVVLVCDKAYVKSADKKTGPVDKESQVVTEKIFAKGDPKKFIAVVLEKDSKGSPCLPGYFKSKRFIDFSDEDFFPESFDQLLRWSFDEPLYIRPDLGKKPSYFAERNVVSLGKPALYVRTLEGLKYNKPYAEAALIEYLEDLVSKLEKFRITDADREFDELLLNNIEQFIPTRNDLVELFRSVALYNPEKDAHKWIHRFFEDAAAYFTPPDDSRAYKEWDFDNFKFIVQELFIYCLACFLKYERFGAAAGLLETRYFVKRKAGEGRQPLAGFNILRNHLQSLDYRNERLGLGHPSLHAELLKKRCLGIMIEFEQLIQADFILYLRDSLDAMKGETSQRWWPETLLFRSSHEGPLEVFARAESREYFEGMKAVFNVQRKDDFEPLFQAYKKRDLFVPQWGEHKIMPARLMAYDRLAMRP